MSEQFPIDTDTEVGDDDALHSFWALSREEILALAGMTEMDKRALGISR